jgi:hypothetical protein
MEKALKALYDVIALPEVLDNDELRIKISNVIMELQSIVASKVKKIERPSSPCPCGSCD